MGVVHGAPVRPAMVVAVLVSWARERLGSALYRQGRRGRSSWGDFDGEDGAGGGDRDGVVACQGTATAVDVVASRGASGGCVAARRGARGKRAGGARAWGGAELAGRGAWPARWRRRRTAAARRPSAGRREVEEPASGSSVNKPKFQNQFCNFKFSPSSWLQKKKC